ncbi:hypothetical protein JOS77_26270 [Chromobacterium haemolyticum]|nr:hypothetical protein JOS77_26270 [Chromobacterium haemolyticum]
MNHHLSLIGAAASSLPLFGMATAFAVAQNGAQPAKPEVLQKEVTEQLTLPAFSFNESATRYWRDEAIKRGDTIARVLNRLGIRDSEANRFLHSSPLSKDLLKLKTGATLSVQTNDLGELFGLRFLNE